MRSLESLFADGGTALYDATSEAHRYLKANPTPDMILAVVVLTDGEDKDSRTTVAQLFEQVRFDSERQNLRVFTIGYGSEANVKSLSGSPPRARPSTITAIPRTFARSSKRFRRFSDRRRLQLTPECRRRLNSESGGTVFTAWNLL